MKKTLKLFALLFVAVAMSCNFVACGGGDKENGEIVKPGGNGSSDEDNDDPNGNENNPDDPDDGTIQEKLLIGTWQGTLLEYFEIYENGETYEEETPLEEGDMTITFYDDHTFKAVYMDGDIVDGEEEGSWRLTGDTLETIYEGEQTDLHVLELTETAFRYEIVNEYGSYTEKGVYTFKRK